MRIGFASVQWAEVVGHDESGGRALGYERIVRKLLAPSVRLPVRRVSLEVDSRVDRRWIAASTHFIRSLPAHDILTVYAYTTPQGFYYVLDMLRGGTKYAELVVPRASDLCPSAARHAALRVWKTDARRGSLDARIKRHLAAEKMIDRSTEETAETGYEAWDRATDELVALRAADAPFLKRVYASFVRHEWSLACVFAHAARRVTTQFKWAFPYLTADAWRAILEQFAADLDSVFARAPPVPALFTVFRGTKRAGVQAEVSTSITVFHGTKRAGAQINGYVSTSMCREVAMEFTDKRDPLVEEITVPRGARLIALCAVSRYPKEAELLLPRHFAS